LLIYLLYNFALIAAYPLFLIYLTIQAFKSEKFSGTMKERFGFYGGAGDRLAGGVIWLHAVSVGEAVGAAPLIRKLLEGESVSLVVSTATKGGKQILEKSFGDAITTAFSPLDFPWVVRRALKAFRPKALILMETEIWPNLISACNRRGIPVLLLNGRVSDRMLKAGGPVRAMYRRLFTMMRAIGMQTERDAERIKELGAPPAAVHVVGNMKYDAAPAGADVEKTEELRRLLRPENGPIFVAGSTHPGEEEIVLDVFQKLRDVEKTLRLVIAPRHIERAGEALEIIKKRGWDTCLRSTMEAGGGASVIVLDTIGELRCLYSLATMCFVGGSLVERGGHNVLEPAACGKAVFYGPYMMNFTESAKVLEDGGGGIPVKNSDELAMRGAEYIANAGLRRKLDDNSLRTVLQNAGAAARAYDLFKELIK